jgi:diaminopimelate decarboxylase
MSLSSEFFYRDNALVCERVDVASLARAYGTPSYVYAKRGIVSRFQTYKHAFAGSWSQICYAVKANSNLAVLRTLAQEGAGFDIVSGGELFRVLTAGGDPAKVVFSGVGKTADEIRFAIDKRIHGFNCESEMEIELISQIASAAGRAVSIALRVNPDVDAATHPYISTGLREHKFGIDIAAAEAVYERAAKLPGIKPNGVSCHIGSQLLDVEPLLEAAGKMCSLVQRLRAKGLPIEFLDLGGGLGVSYNSNDQAAAIPAYIERLRKTVEPLDLTIMLEPGRSIVAEAGILLTTVLLVKDNGNKRFVIVDAAMNDLIRPALYHAHHEIVPVIRNPDGGRMIADVVGPVCETGDFFARDRDLPSVGPGDLLAICTAGAYGFAQSSNYNSRPRACELLIDASDVYEARRRETYNDLIRGESAGG